MKATLEIPDDLYRRVKARSALEGRPLRSVAVQLFQNWLNDESSPLAAASVTLSADRKPTRFDKAPWLEIIKPYIKPEMSHDMDEIRTAIAMGWAEDMMDKLNLPSPKP